MSKDQLLKHISQWVLSRLSGEAHKELNELIDMRDDADLPLSEDEKRLVAAALRFDEIEADEVSVPRSDIITLNHDDSLEKIIQTFIACKHSRLPVAKESRDEIIGFITLKDILPFTVSPKGFSLEKVIRPMVFVPENMPISSVLALMKKQHAPFAIVVDEYGGTSGLVSLKDIMETLVGEVQDEHEAPDPVMMHPLGSGKYRIDPKMPLEELEQRLGDNLTPGIDKDDREFETVGGLILHLAGRMPQPEESFTLPNGETMVVKEADNRKIQKLELIMSRRLKHVYAAS